MFGITSHVPSIREVVPRAVVIYTGLSLLDLGFSLLAFTIGLKEGNPILAWYAENGLFEAAKLLSTLAVVFVGFYFWTLRPIRLVVYGANVAMFGVLMIHLAFWVNHLQQLGAR